MGRTLLALLLAAVFLGVFPGRAAAQETVHFVQPGENLFRIGLHYGVSWETLMAYNGLSSTQITVGQRLVIPGATAAAPQPASSGLVHVVQAGETLSAIGARYGVAWPDLMAVNGLVSSRIGVGQALTIPGVVSVLPELGGQAATVGHEGPTHVVQPGETLFLIGLRYNICLLYTSPSPRDRS